MQQAGFPAKETLAIFPGEVSKPVQILGLEVYGGENGVLMWRRKTPVKPPAALKSLRDLAGCVGKMAPANLPILKWLRPYAQILRSMIGREAGTKWSADPSESLISLTSEFSSMVLQDDPAGGRWGTRLNPDGPNRWTLCCDASQIAMGAVLIAGASVDTANTVADFCWLNTKPRQINILEAEAVVRV